MIKIKYIGVGAVIFLVLVGFFLYFNFYSKSDLKSQPEPQISLENQKYSLNSEDLKNYKVPEEGELINNEVAVPVEVSNSAPNAESNYREYEIKGENKELFPKEIRIYQNDIVSIRLYAVDNDYDFAIPVYGISTKVDKNGDKRIEFQANTVGKFPFFCSICSKENQGYLIVIPKTQ